MILGSTTDKLEIVTSGTADIHTIVSYADIDDTTRDVFVDRQVQARTTAATHELLAPPASGFSRKAKWISISNKHASVANDVTVNYNANGTLYEIEKLTLQPGERMSFVEGRGFKLFNSSGMEKTIFNSNPSILTKKSIADHPNSTTTATEVTDLSLGCGVGTWIFEYFLIFRSATSTVGPKLSVNYDGTVTTFLQTLSYLSGLTTDSTGVIDQDAVVPQVMAGMAKRAKDATGTLIGTAGVDTINVDTLITISGIAIVTVAGNFELWHGSETATSTTVMTGSSLRLTQIGA
jgi:hypothetical protein